LLLLRPRHIPRWLSRRSKKKNLKRQQKPRHPLFRPLGWLHKALQSSKKCFTVGYGRWVFRKLLDLGPDSGSVPRGSVQVQTYFPFSRLKSLNSSFKMSSACKFSCCQT
jgi:hypothetical protein